MMTKNGHAPHLRADGTFGWNSERPRRYFLSYDSGPEQEVCRHTYIRAERACGFSSKHGGDHEATAAFTGHDGRSAVSGRYSEYACEARLDPCDYSVRL